MKFNVRIARMVHDSEVRYVEVEAGSVAEAARLVTAQATDDDNFWHDCKCFAIDTDAPAIVEIKEVK